MLNYGRAFAFEAPEKGWQGSICDHPLCVALRTSAKVHDLKSLLP